MWCHSVPWRDERHIYVTIASDASAFGWGGSMTSPMPLQVSDYWAPDEVEWDVSVKEAIALERVLFSFPNTVQNMWVDALVDNQAVVAAWHAAGGRSPRLNWAVKRLFFATITLNVHLCISHVSSHDNPADAPSRRLSASDCCLDAEMWNLVQQRFGGVTGHTCALMALDSNVMWDLQGHLLPHFTPWLSPNSAAVNVFAQDLSRQDPILSHPYVFPPLVMVGALSRFLKQCRRSSTLVTLDVYPRKYWWPLLQEHATLSLRVAWRGDQSALRVPSSQGWVPHPGLSGDLWVFALDFTAG
jgi:hypothetical protein